MLALCGLLGLLMYSPQPIASADETPERTQSVVAALKNAQWEQIEVGFRSLRGQTPDGITVTAFGILPDHFSFHIGLQSDDRGERASDVGYRERAKIAVNAGFFAENDEGYLAPVGYLRVDGQRFSKGWHRSGGYLVVEEEGLQLVPTGRGVPVGEADTLQSKPMLIEPGQQWSMRTNAGNLKHRTLLCRMADGEIILFTVTRSGMSLYEAGWVMRSRQEGGFFGCDSALALDGGRSTQVWVEDRPDLSFAGVSPVHNFLLIRRKEHLN